MFTKIIDFVEFGVDLFMSISEEYVSQKRSLIEYFKKNNSKLAATTDRWTSGSHFSIMTVTVCWIDEDFTMRNVILGFRQLEGHHSGINVCTLFVGILKEFEIKSKVI